VLGAVEPSVDEAHCRFGVSGTSNCDVCRGREVGMEVERDDELAGSV
jgi:hypothetical protein